ncbi:MAG: glycosyltransferase family 2 protein [Lachnospiraceae bacterium]|nr:glycosyltransferase family 2 protein [Lachnospiraceae bacterium]
MYSIVIPCYKSAGTIETVVSETAKEMDNMGRHEYEFILVNDCSPDGGATIKKLREIATERNYVRVVDLARNSGQHNAMMAGLRAASGEVFISMDDDMQTRPSELHKMFRAFDEGYDVVYGAYPEKKESMFRRFGSWVNKMCAVVFLGRPKELKTSSFWIIRKYVRDSIISYEGAHSYLLGLILRSTSSITQVEVEHFEREIGASGYTLRALLRLWSNIIGFTVKPLRLAMQGGMLISTISVIFALGIFIRKLVHPSIDPGWSSIMVAIFFSLGVELFFIGMIGEYIGRTYMHINKEPQYIVKAKYNFDEDK